jgi:hypothetical protein
MDFLRGCQREGVFRLERDRRGLLRVFPGTNLQSLQSLQSLQRSMSPVEMGSKPEADETNEPSASPSMEVQQAGMHPESQSAPPEEDEPENAERGMSDVSPESQEQVARPTRAPRVRKTVSGKPAARRTTGRKPAANRSKKLKVETTK